MIPRRGRRDTELEDKEVRVGGRRYIVCRNLAEAKRDVEVREAVLRIRGALSVAATKHSSATQPTVVI